MRNRAKVVCLTALACLLLSGPADLAGQAQPEIRVVDLKGLDLALAKYQGEAILLNFWAIWCEPCVAEMPDLLAVGREFRGKGGRVVTVSYDMMIPDVTPDAALKQVRAFAAKQGMDVPVLIFDGPDYDAINKRFGLPGPVPVSITLDRKGTVVERHSGKSSREDFAGMLRRAIGK